MDVSTSLYSSRAAICTSWSLGHPCPQMRATWSIPTAALILAPWAGCWIMKTWSSGGLPSCAEAQHTPYHKWHNVQNVAAGLPACLLGALLDLLCC